MTSPGDGRHGAIVSWRCSRYSVGTIDVQCRRGSWPAAIYCRRNHDYPGLEEHHQTGPCMVTQNHCLRHWQHCVILGD